MKDKFSHYICLYYDSGFVILEVSVDKSSDDRGGAVLFDHLDSSSKVVWPVFQALSEWRRATERPSDKRRFRLSGKRACLMA